MHFAVLPRFVPADLAGLVFLVSRRLSEAALTRRPKHLLGSIGDVEEAVRVPVARINVSHAGGHAGHAPLCHQEEETFGGVQINLVPDRQRCRRGWSETSLSQPSQMAASHSPEQTEELAQGQLEGNQELCLVQQREALFTDVTFNNYLKTEVHNRAVIEGTESKLCICSTEWQLTGNLLGNLERMMHTSSFLVSRKLHE